MFSLSGKLAIVTGASSGIGLAVAERFLSAGASLVGIDRSARPSALPFEILEADVSNEKELASAIAQIAQGSERLDIMVNNAGIQPLGISIEDTSSQLLERTLAVNLSGVAYGIKHASKHMSQGGRILNTGSFVGSTGVPQSAAYATSKAAVMHLTRLAALELAPRGITVNAVCPGTIATPAVTEIPDNPEIPFAASRTPLGRLGQPEEVAAAFHFLASDEASYLTGVNLPVDGGISAGWERYDTIAPAAFQDGKWTDP